MVRSLWIFLFLGLLGCKGEPAPRSEGVLTDRGPTAAMDRYVLDLGPVGPGARAYYVADLPSTEFVIGLQVSGLGPKEARDQVGLKTAVAEFLLADSSGRVILHEVAPLAQWVWSCGVRGCEDAFAYRRGVERDVQLRNGLHEMRRENQGPAAGWGTFFLPKPREEYQLRVSLDGLSELVAGEEVRLLARGGGWK